MTRRDLACGRALDIGHWYFSPRSSCLVYHLLTTAYYLPTSVLPSPGAISSPVLGHPRVVKLRSTGRHVLFVVQSTQGLRCRLVSAADRAADGPRQSSAVGCVSEVTMGEPRNEYTHENLEARPAPFGAYLSRYV